MRKIRRLLILFFTVLTSALYGQNSIVKGTVKNASSGVPLYGVTVLDESNHGATTDISGNYELNLNAGKHTLSFKYISFVEKKETVDLADGETRVLNIALVEESKELGTVVVSASKFEQKLED